GGHSWLAGFTWRLTPSPRVMVTQRVFTTGLGYRNSNRDGAVLDDNPSNEVTWRGDATLVVKPAFLVHAGGDAQRLSGRHTERRALNDEPDLRLISNYRLRGVATSAYADVVAQARSRFTLTVGGRLDRWGPTNRSTPSPWAAVDVAVLHGFGLHVG